jgi:F-type H+-transporting ATPase subunit b
MKYGLGHLAFWTASGAGFAAAVSTGGVRLALPAAPLAMLVAAAPAGELPHELIFNIVNFLLLVFVLGYLLRKPAASFFSQRSQTIHRQLEQAREALEEAKAKLSEVEEKAAHLEQEIQNLRAAAQKDMEFERQRLRQETAQEALKIERLAEAQVATALRAAKAELRNYAAGEVIVKAQEAIRRGWEDANQRRLVGFFVADLGSKASRN